VSTKNRKKKLKKDDTARRKCKCPFRMWSYKFGRSYVCRTFETVREGVCPRVDKEFGAPKEHFVIVF
jgi:hypothetical protein